MSRPLISYVIVSYNQESFIREAIESALAQTYSPLEIIITDDCSQDRSFEITQQVAAAYKGPHTIRLHRNSTNLGIAGNLTNAAKLCRGELIVGMAGDDVALPSRVAVICDAWEWSGRKATSIFSSYITVSTHGDVQGIGGQRCDAGTGQSYQILTGDLSGFLTNKVPVVNGCTHAWSPELFRYFGSLTSDFEDLVLSFRTLAIGQLLYIREPLLKYRRHDSNVSFLAEKDDTRSFDHREKRLRWVNEKTVAAYDNMFADTEILFSRGRITAAQRDRLLAEGRRVRSFYAAEHRMMAESLLERLSTLAGTVRDGNVHCTLRFMPRLLPRPIYRRLYLLRQRLKSSVQPNGSA